MRCEDFHNFLMNSFQKLGYEVTNFEVNDSDFMMPWHNSSSRYSLANKRLKLTMKVIMPEDHIKFYTGLFDTYTTYKVPLPPVDFIMGNFFSDSSDPYHFEAPYRTDYIVEFEFCLSQDYFSTTRGGTFEQISKAFKAAWDSQESSRFDKEVDKMLTGHGEYNQTDGLK